MRHMRQLLLAGAAIAVMGAGTPGAIDRTGEATAVTLLNDYAVRYDQAANDMAKGALRPERGHTLCTKLAFIPDRGAVHDWVGTVETSSSTGDGRGVFVVRIAPHVTVGTTNNGLSESITEFKTLMAPASSVYQLAVSLKLGQQVRFSGTLFPSKVDCMLEKSITMDGSIHDPEFLFRFSDVRAAE
jgi:hypothetical protein